MWYELCNFKVSTAASTHANVPGTNFNIQHWNYQYHTFLEKIQPKSIRRKGLEELSKLIYINT